jgi:hypothetical protein
MWRASVYAVAALTCGIEHFVICRAVIPIVFSIAARVIGRSWTHPRNKSAFAFSVADIVKFAVFRVKIEISSERVVSHLGLTIQSPLAYMCSST